jgi:hypothetical protein
VLCRSKPKTSKLHQACRLITYSPATGPFVLFCKHNNVSAKFFAIVFIHKIWWSEYGTFHAAIGVPNVRHYCTLQSRSGQRINHRGSLPFCSSSLLQLAHRYMRLLRYINIPSRKVLQNTRLSSTRCLSSVRRSSSSGLSSPSSHRF